MGYTWLGWYDGTSLISSSTSYTFTVSKPITLTAKWIKNYNVVLKQNIASAGTVTGDGKYDSGTSVTIIATTNRGCIFVGWVENDEMISTNETYTFEISEDKTITAVYDLNEEYAGLEDFHFTISFYNCKITGVSDKTKTEYIIPDCVTSIGDRAFYGCENLKNINYCGTKWQWDKISKGTYWAHFYWGETILSLKYTMTYNYVG